MFSLAEERGKERERKRVCVCVLVGIEELKRRASQPSLCVAMHVSERLHLFRLKYRYLNMHAFFLGLQLLGGWEGMCVGVWEGMYLTP